MSVSGTQTLTVADWKAGEVYSWATTSGSINPSTGNSVTYTAPSSNVNCASNPTITLTCGGNVVDTIQIAVNGAFMDTTVAFNQMESQSVLCACCEHSTFGMVTAYLININHYRCDGSFYYTSYSLSCYTPNAGCTKQGNTSSYTLCDWDYIDKRTTYMFEQGCCPAQLL
jgi:hypothetical protein